MNLDEYCTEFKSFLAIMKDTPPNEKYIS